jgi:hypothetical protein
MSIPSRVSFSSNHSSVVVMLFLTLQLMFGVMPVWATPQGDSFTYQGHLNDKGVPAEGDYDLEFTLTDAAAAGNALDTLQIAAVTVSDGVFTVDLDFGISHFNGEERWLEIGVKSGGELVFTVLAPRQQISSVPYALYAKSVAADSVGSVEAISGEVQLRVSGGCIGGSSISSISENGGVICDPDDTATWKVVDPFTIYTPSDFVGVNQVAPIGTLHVSDAGSTKPAIFVEGAGVTEGDLVWPFDETLHLGTWSNRDGFGFDLKMQIDGGGTAMFVDDMAFADDERDKISLFGDRIGQDDMYGFGIATNTLIYKANGAHSWLIKNNAGAAPEMHLTSTGLGVGTNAPNHELVVQGDDPVIQLRDDTLNNSANAARIELLERSNGTFDGGAFMWWNGELNRFYIGTKNGGVNTNQIVIDRSSNSVGIGTQDIDSNHRLSVNGSIRAKEIVVEVGWADYVFDDAYQLRPLDEVQAFIDQNGHLPDVPSAADVARDGVSVGEMEATLLQKVEELTLYTIELNSRVQELEARLEGAGT